MAYLCGKCAKENTHAGFVEINFVDLQDFLIDSERYAIGRCSYYPPTVIEHIQKYSKYMSNKTRCVIIADIERWLEGTHSSLDYSEEWAELAKELQEGVVNEK